MGEDSGCKFILEVVIGPATLGARYFEFDFRVPAGKRLHGSSHPHDARSQVA
jgi:hypothetical protein